MPDERLRGAAVSGPAAALALDSRCRLGESIVWCERRAALFWADISGARLWMHRPGDGATRNWSVPAALGCVALCDDGRLLLGLAKGLHLADPDNAGDELPLHHVVDVEADIAGTRINDGRCDRHGNFVFGTKCENPGNAARGGFYQFSMQHGLRRLALPAAKIPNSICFARDGRTLYFCDSRVPEISRCNYEPMSAGVADVRRFIAIGDASAAPDGSIIDADGCLWNAQWGAARVVRYFPDGRWRSSVAVPATNPSCCAFGGAALDRLYITSAREELSDAQLAVEPHAGGVFRATIADARGLPESRVAT